MLKKKTTARDFCQIFVISTQNSISLGMEVKI